jgi:hypothetical protein
MDIMQASWPLQSGLPARPGRKTLTLWTIASYWHAREGNPLRLDYDGIEDPYCFGCERIPLTCDLEAPTPKARWDSAGLDRAHLIDRCRGGLDGPQNIIPLCFGCHRGMPAFIPGQEAEVIAWVLSLGTRIEYPPRPWPAAV